VSRHPQPSSLSDLTRRRQGESRRRQDLPNI
jgi:hypothetical protein